MQSYVLILQFLQTFIFKEGSEVFSWEKKIFKFGMAHFRGKIFSKKIYIEGRNVNEE